MAGEIFAAFRTILILISISWLSVMYLLVYRIPRLERGQENAGAVYYESESKSRDSSEINGDLNNPRRKLQFAYTDQTVNFGQPDFAESILDSQGFVKDKQRFDSRNFDCRDLNKVKLLGVLGSGYTKTVRRGILNGRQFAMKYSTERNHDIVECKKQRGKSRHFECYNLAKFKLLKEALLFQQLRHPNIVELYGVCPWRSNDVEGTESVMTVITEVGRPLDIMELIQIPWDERFKMALDLVGLMLFFETSPLGSLRVRDFRIDQFVMINGVIKLTDLDDVDAKRKPCLSAEDCFVGGLTGNTTLSCENQLCVRYESMSNLYSLDRTFLDNCFNFDNPDWIGKDLKVISQKVKSFSVGLKELQTELRRIVEDIKTGVYSKNFVENAKNQTHQLQYEVFPDASIASADYYCRQSRSTSSCELAVASLEEAKIVCSLDKECKALVFTPNTNWLGQKIIVLKNSGRTLTPITKHTTFVRSE